MYCIRVWSGRSPTLSRRAAETSGIPENSYLSLVICSWKISCVKIHYWPLRFLRIRGAIFWKGYFIALTLPLISILSIRLSLLMSAFMQSGITNWWLSALWQGSKLKSFKSVWIDFLLHIYSAESPILFRRFSGPPKHENISHGYEKKRLRDDAIYVFWEGYR